MIFLSASILSKKPKKRNCFFLLNRFFAKKTLRFFRFCVRVILNSINKRLPIFAEIKNGALFLPFSDRCMIKILSPALTCFTCLALFYGLIANSAACFNGTSGVCSNASAVGAVWPLDSGSVAAVDFGLFRVSVGVIGRSVFEPDGAVRSVRTSIKSFFRSVLASGLWHARTNSTDSAPIFLLTAEFSAPQNRLWLAVRSLRL